MSNDIEDQLQCFVSFKPSFGKLITLGFLSRMGDCFAVDGPHQLNAYRVRTNPLQMTLRFSIRTLLLSMTLVGLSFGSYVWICKNGISTASVLRIENGMTKSELIEMLGKPHRTYPTGCWEFDV